MAFVFKKGDDFLAAFKKLLAERGIKSAFFYGLGGFSKATLAFYDLKRKKYVERKFKNGPFEAVGLTGNVAVDEKGELVIHCHTVLGKRDFRTAAGHLASAIVGGTLEVLVTPVEGLQRRKDNGTGLSLLEE